MKLVLLKKLLKRHRGQKDPFEREMEIDKRRQRETLARLEALEVEISNTRRAGGGTAN